MTFDIRKFSERVQKVTITNIVLNNVLQKYCMALSLFVSRAKIALLRMLRLKTILKSRRYGACHNSLLLSRFQTLKQTSGDNSQYHQAILKVSPQCLFKECNNVVVHIL
jgi:hypothetical protein